MGLSRRNLKVDFVASGWPKGGMHFVIPFPDISPEIFTIPVGGFSFSLRWYALAYIAGLLIAWRMIVAMVRAPRLWSGDAPISAGQIEDLLTWVILGVVLGGRLGYVLFYQPAYYLANPLQIPVVWEGGMSFHGGLLGVITAGLIFCRKYGLPAWSVADLMAVSVAPGLFLGRIANFINAELWGRPSTLPWAVVFPGDRAQDCPLDWVGDCARHPSQLYEAGLEGLLMGSILMFLAWRKGWLKTPSALTGAFFAGYGLSRFIVEFFRQADAQFVAEGNPWGHVVQWGSAGLTMGQILSLPMILLGIALVWRARRKAGRKA